MMLMVVICTAVIVCTLLLVVLQAKTLAKCEMVCVFCGTKQHFAWKRLLFRQHVGNDWWLDCSVCGCKTWFTARRKEQKR